MSRASLPPPPIKETVIAQNGRLTIPWTNWFINTFDRIGGSIAPSNSELGTQISDFLSLSSQVAALQTTVNNHTAQIAALNGDGLGQGPVL